MFITPPLTDSPLAYLLLGGQLIRSIVRVFRLAYREFTLIAMEEDIPFFL
jgi:hypothetical protein